MEYELVNTYGLNVTRQKGIPVIWKGMRLDLGFRSDLIVENKVIVELKSVELLPPVLSKTGSNSFETDKSKTGAINKF